MIVRNLREEEWGDVAELIFHSTNEWYQRNLNRGCFPGDDAAICRIFPEVYEGLDPGCCLVAEIDGKLAGSCFYHPRETHVALGIMNASAGFSGKGVAKALLQEIIGRANGLPVRLVSSALNLDSYSLYTRMGFAPHAIYQDMYFPKGKTVPVSESGVRAAGLQDVEALVALEEKSSGIRRGKDFQYFIQNELKIWRGYVLEREGEIRGFLFSVNHPGSRMLGPGVMANEETALALIGKALADFGEESPLMLVPANATGLIQSLYRCGARNCELHLSQVLGETQSARGIVMPTFMPETG